MGTDKNGNILPPGIKYKDYEWVFVKIMDECDNVLSVPRIARYISELNRWVSVDENIIYSNKKYDKHNKKVIAWKPIPGTEWEDLYVGGKIKERFYRYN